MVSVLCITYNHAPYIRDALEGFVRQRTDFRFEVLVHDDASEDGTADIVREYAARYPDLIRPVLQTANQYSRGVQPTRTFLRPLVRGRYVAFCEGDDYWTDSGKLQKQVDALEAHPEADICAHPALSLWPDGSRHIMGPKRGGKVIPAERVILGGGAFVATASLLCRSSIYLKDSAMRDILFNDYTLQIQGSLRGGMLYLPDCMSAYRFRHPGSWTASHRAEDPLLLARALDALDAETAGRFHRAIRRRERRDRLEQWFKRR